MQTLGASSGKAPAPPSCPDLPRASREGGESLACCLGAGTGWKWISSSTWHGRKFLIALELVSIPGRWRAGQRKFFFPPRLVRLWRPGWPPAWTAALRGAGLDPSQLHNSRILRKEECTNSGRRRRLSLAGSQASSSPSAGCGARGAPPWIRALWRFLRAKQASRARLLPSSDTGGLCRPSVRLFLRLGGAPGSPLRGRGLSCRARGGVGSAQGPAAHASPPAWRAEVASSDLEGPGWRARA